MNALVVGNDYLANRFAYLLKKLSISCERTSRFTKSSPKQKDFVFFSGKNCLSKSIMDSLRAGCSVFSEQMLFEKKSDLSLIKYAERNNLGLAIGSFDVFNPVIGEIKKIIGNERIFEIFFNRVGPKQFGYVKLNIVDDLVIQDIGIITHLLEGDTKLISAFSDDIFNYCVAHMKNKETNVFLYANKNVYYKERTVQLFAEKTKISANLLSQKLMLMRSEGINKSLYETGYESYKEQAIKKTEPLKEAIEKFVNGKHADYGNIEKNMQISFEIKRVLHQFIQRPF